MGFRIKKNRPHLASPDFGGGMFLAPSRHRRYVYVNVMASWAKRVPLW